MDIVITGRRTEATDRFRRLAEEKLTKVSQFTPSAYRIDVEQSHERNPRQFAMDVADEQIARPTPSDTSSAYSTTQTASR